MFGEPSLIAPSLPRLTGARWIQATWPGSSRCWTRRWLDYVLTNARGVFGPLMTEYVFAYMLARERLILEKLESQRAMQWDTSHPGTLQGKQIGLLGVGTIGAAIARTAKHFGMRVKGYTRASTDCPDVDEYFTARAGWHSRPASITWSA